MADAGRVIAGQARGIRLQSPGAGTRPLADRTKQAVFAALEFQLPGSAVLDLCAGAGAAGIEALSRGAARAVFIDDDAGACRTIAANLERTDLAGAARVVRAGALAYLRGRRDAAGATAGRAGGRPEAAADGPFDLVIVDPPYAETALRDAILAELAAPDAPLTAGALVVVTAHWRAAPGPTGLLRSARERRFGETLITTFRRAETGSSQLAEPGTEAEA